MANSVNPEETAPIGAVCSVPTLFASILNSSLMKGNYLQQTTSAGDIFRCFFLGALRVKKCSFIYVLNTSELDKRFPALRLIEKHFTALQTEQTQIRQLLYELPDQGRYILFAYGK